MSKFFSKDETPYISFSLDFTRELLTLESNLHSCEDPQQIALDSLKAGAEFYEGDWCGIIECDLEMEVWTPVLWYNTKTNGMTTTSINDLEDTTHLER